MATFTDDTTIMAIGKDHKVAAFNLRTSLNQINSWTKQNGEVN